MIAETARVVRRGNEVAAEGVHLGQRADHAGVAEVISVDAASEARAGSGLDRDDLIVSFAAQFFAHKGSDQAAQVGAAAGAADDHVGLDAVFVQRGLGLKTDDGLMQEHLIENGAEHIAIAGIGDRDFHRLGDRAAKGTCGAGMLSQDLASDLCRVGGGRCDGSAVCAHHFAAERLLLIADLDHEDLAVQIKIGASHGEGGAPLARAGLGRHALKALLLGVVGLRAGRIELVAAAGVIALELVIDMRGGLKLFFQTVRAYKRGRAVHLVKILDLLGNREEAGVVVELLLNQFLAEHAFQLLSRHGLMRAGIQKGSGLVLHVRPQVVPRGGNLVL